MYPSVPLKFDSKAKIFSVTRKNNHYAYIRALFFIPTGNRFTTAILRLTFQKKSQVS